MYTQVATICIEHSIGKENSVSYRFLTELGMTTSLTAMKKFIKELHSTRLVQISHDKANLDFFKTNVSKNNVSVIQKMNIKIRNEDLAKIDSDDEVYFLCNTNGIINTRDELEWFLAVQLGLDS